MIWPFYLSLLSLVIMIPSYKSLTIQSIQFSDSVMSNSLWPHGLQHARIPCPSPTPGTYSNSCPLRWWCHPTISSSVIPFSSCPQSLPASESFSMSQFFAWGGSHSLYQGIFRTKRLNTCLLHCRQILYWVTKEDVRGIHTHTNTHTHRHTHTYIYIHAPTYKMEYYSDIEKKEILLWQHGPWGHYSK